MAGESRSDQCAKECNGCPECEPRTAFRQTLDSFSDEEIQKEIRIRKVKAKTAETRKIAIDKHNGPIERQIRRLEKELADQKKQLKN